MYFSSHLSDKQYFSSRKIDENVVFLATTHDNSGLTRRELSCVVTRNETLSGYRNCISLGATFCLQVEEKRISICLKIITVTLVTGAFDLDCLKMVTMMGVLKL